MPRPIQMDCTRTTHVPSPESTVAMPAAVEWIRADEQLPSDGVSVAAAVTGRYPVRPETDGDPLSDEEFWLVLPMHFRRLHLVEETGETIEKCFYDSDGVIRFPIGGPDSDGGGHALG